MSVRYWPDVMTLERTSDSSRGPAVEYGPGLLFEDLMRKGEF